MGELKTTFAALADLGAVAIAYAEALGYRLPEPDVPDLSPEDEIASRIYSEGQHLEFNPSEVRRLRDKDRDMFDGVMMSLDYDKFFESWSDSAVLTKSEGDNILFQIAPGLPVNIELINALDRAHTLRFGKKETPKSNRMGEGGRQS